jgi:hypothetical protein
LPLSQDFADILHRLGGLIDRSISNQRERDRKAAISPQFD